MTIAEFLKVEDMTPKAFAKRVGVSRMCVSYWMRGERVPRRKQMQRISRVTGGRVEPRDFYRAKAS